MDGAYDDPASQLEQYFSGQYLEFWEAEFAEYRDKSWSTTGDVRTVIESAGSYEPASASGPETIKIYACVDFRETTVVDEDGQEQERGFDFSLDEVQMVNTSDGWMADSVGSAVLRELEDTPCAGVLAS
ncbi:hypothetical protein DT076_05700 [Desertihabitans brevis]|uniref:Uncharacterized protein n=1 Tax=Desertihabitans brevis TaxID=2268447 RepID=A0A367YWH3_9ACTN|nr:hypothetical protein DT076_05700 [Desertihabitans brevis]